MEEAGEPIEDALLFALEDLRGGDFKRFKNKLCFLAMEGKARIPWSKLEKADPVDTLHLLIEAYGKEGAQEVAVEVLRDINLQDSATRLQQRHRYYCRKKYRRHIQEAFGRIPEPDSHPSPTVGLHHRYTELLLSRKRRLAEKAHGPAATVESHPEDCLPVDMENVFASEAERQGSRTVVLLGPPGVGKTTALWKLMLDWASGRIWQERFAYVFYIPCQAVMRSAGPLCVADLLLNDCPPGSLLVEDVLMNQNNTLILLDGFDELRAGDAATAVPSGDPHKKQAPQNVVLGLLEKKLLARCHLLVAAQPVALGPLQPHLRSPQFVEVLGFRPAQAKEYFHRFFEDEEDAAQAFGLARRNEALLGLCFLPVVCWILCSLFKERPQRDPFQAIPGTATVTELHMRLLFSLLGPPSKLSNLQGLCSLASDGMRRKSMAFDAVELNKHGLRLSDMETFSANGRVLHRGARLPTVYRFTHFGFQEFFAALFYLMHAGENIAASLKDLHEGFGNKGRSGACLMMARFLFGLSSTRRLSALQNTWGCKPSRMGLEQELLRWTEEGVKHHSFRRRENLLELCHCVYEMEDLGFAKNVMGQVRNLDLQSRLSSKLDFEAVAFCLSAADALHTLRLADYELESTRLSRLLPGLLKSSEIQLNRCGLTAAACKSLASITVTNRNLASLDLGENPLGDLGVIHLCDQLIDSHCNLQTLRLHRCHLTVAACEPLSLVLASSRCLTTLDLGENHLGDVGVQKLCEGLKHPQSRLQRLALHLCGLTAAVCEDLASVLETSDTLVEMGLGGNKLGDEGVRQICIALRKPACKLQRLALTMSFLNLTTQKRLQAARAARPQITLVSYYPPSLPAFPGEEEGQPIKLVRAAGVGDV